MQAKLENREDEIASQKQQISSLEEEIDDLLATKEELNRDIEALKDMSVSATPAKGLFSTGKLAELQLEDAQNEVCDRYRLLLYIHFCKKAERFQSELQDAQERFDAEREVSFLFFQVFNLLIVGTIGHVQGPRGGY